MSKKEKILLIGATGFTGQQVLKVLLTRKDVEVTCFLRPKTNPPVIEEGSYKITRGNLDDKESIKTALAGKDGMIYVASLGFGHAENIVQACEEMQTSKCVFTSTTALLTKLNAASKKVRLAAEKTIRQSKLNWVILRPTMIYGLKGDRNMERLVKHLKKFRLLAVPGRLDALQQPIHVTDVAQALVGAYFSSKTVGKIYNISGEKPLTFKQVVQTIGQVLGIKTWLFSIPLKPCLWFLNICEHIKFYRGLKAEQLLRLNEDKAFDHDEAKKDFNFKPKSFKTGIEELVQSLYNDHGK